MNIQHRAPLIGATTFTLALLLAACGGGGGGGGTTPPVGGGGGGGGSTPTPPGATPTPVTTSTPTPGASGMLSISGTPLASTKVVFTCGCNGDAGTTTTDATGNYTIGDSAPDVLGKGNYTPSGHNLMVVGYASSGTQAWTMLFFANSPANDLTLGSNTSDTASTAAALYVFYAASLVKDNDKTFDWFNFNQIIKFANELRTAPSTTGEKALMNDIPVEQAAGHSLFPYVPVSWDPAHTTTANAKIAADVKLIASETAQDSTIPTQCPSVGGCSGAPTP